MKYFFSRKDFLKYFSDVPETISLEDQKHDDMNLSYL
jgi:hypothetical protein